MPWCIGELAAATAAAALLASELAAAGITAETVVVPALLTPPIIAATAALVEAEAKLYDCLNANNAPGAAAVGAHLAELRSDQERLDALAA